MSPGFIDAVLEGRRDEAESLAGIALPDGWPDAHDRRFLAFRLRQLREQPELEPWFVYGVVLPEDGHPMIGHAGFHGPPGVNAVKADDAVEVGYPILGPDRRGARPAGTRTPGRSASRFSSRTAGAVTRRRSCAP